MAGWRTLINDGSGLYYHYYYCYHHQIFLLIIVVIVIVIIMHTCDFLYSISLFGGRFPSNALISGEYSLEKWCTFFEREANASLLKLLPKGYPT